MIAEVAGSSGMVRSVGRLCGDGPRSMDRTPISLERPLSKVGTANEQKDEYLKKSSDF